MDTAIERRVRMAVSVSITLVVAALVAYNGIQETKQIEPGEVSEVGGPFLTLPEMGAMVALIGGVAVVMSVLERRRGGRS